MRAPHTHVSTSSKVTFAVFMLHVSTRARCSLFVFVCILAEKLHIAVVDGSKTFLLAATAVLDFFNFPTPKAYKLSLQATWKLKHKHESTGSAKMRCDTAAAARAQSNSCLGYKRIRMCICRHTVRDESSTLVYRTCSRRSLPYRQRLSACPNSGSSFDKSFPSCPPFADMLLVLVSVLRSTSRS